MVPRVAVNSMPIREETWPGRGEIVEMLALNHPPGTQLPHIDHARTQTLVDPDGVHFCQMPGTDEYCRQSLNGEFTADALKDSLLDGTVVMNGHVTVGDNSLSLGDRGSRVETSEEEEDEIFDVSTRPLLSRRNDEAAEEWEGRVEEQEMLVAEEEKETSLSILLQLLLPYLIAGFGMVGAGMVLDVVQHSAVFENVTELFILVPALLGLKGNLEMTLASRLSTQANLGNMDTLKEKLKMIFGNMALIQVQAIVVAFLASMFAMAVSWIRTGQFPVSHTLLLCASSICTASVASFVLGSLMVGVVLLSRRMNINPDNVATPIAASLGDLITLAMLAGAAAVLYSAIDKYQWLSPTCIALFFLLLPMWTVFSMRNRYSSDIIFVGWLPVLCAMIISSLGGYILEFAVVQHKGFAVFQPVINGVGGNLVAVHASRISTYLHRRGSPGNLSAGTTKGCANPITFFFGRDVKGRAVRVLLLLVVPGHLVFICIIYYMGAGHTSITLHFALFYLLAAIMQVILLLYISEWMVHLIWRRGEDPDNEVIPYLTAIGDLLGTGLLALAFQALYLIGDRDADVGD